MTDDEMIELFRTTTSVAVVGMSPHPHRASHDVAAYLDRRTDWTVHYVNPTVDEIDGRPVYASLADLPEPPDMVNVFRRIDHVPAVIGDAIAVGAGSVWLQLGLADAAAAATARAAGLVVVEDACLKIEHARLARRLD